MPNPGKSLEELKESGTYKRHSGRYRARVQAAKAFTPLGPPPRHLDEREADAWNEIRKKAAPGTLSTGDFMLVELAARLLVKSRYDRANFTATESRILQSLANDLGMSPLKRGRVPRAEKPMEGDSKWAKLERVLSGRESKPN